MIDSDGKRLSKRNRSLEIEQVRNLGILPEKVIGWIAWLAGWMDQPYALRAEEVIPLFALQMLPRSDIQLDREVLKALIG